MDFHWFFEGLSRLRFGVYIYIYAKLPNLAPYSENWRLQARSEAFTKSFKFCTFLIVFLGSARPSSPPGAGPPRHVLPVQLVKAPALGTGRSRVRPPAGASENVTISTYSEGGPEGRKRCYFHLFCSPRIPLGGLCF